MCDEIKIARLEVKQEEHMRNFERHCGEESENFDALFSQVRKIEASLQTQVQRLEKSLNAIDRTLSNQKTFIGAMVLFIGSLFSVVVVVVQYFGKT